MQRDTRKTQRRDRRRTRIRARLGGTSARPRLCVFKSLNHIYAQAIDDEKGLLLQTRPAFGGNIMATIVCPGHRPQMATVRHKVMKPLDADPARRGKVVRERAARPLLSSRVDFVRFAKDVTQAVNIAEADIIVSGGRGRF